MSKRDQQIEAEVNRRVETIDRARRIAPNEDYRNQTADGIRAIAVSAVRGPEAIDGKSPDAIAGLFDHLVENAAKGDPVRRALH